MLMKKDYPYLEEGAAMVYLYIGDDAMLADEWLVDLQEFTE